MTTQISNYHKPAMLQEVISSLVTNPNGCYVDVTYGGGGHSSAIFNMLDQGRLVAFDRDRDAQVNLFEHERFTFIEHDFIYMKNYLKYLDLLPVQGILADLGVSSHQFDTDERGFSFRFDAELDMRMDQDATLNASHIVNEYSEADLQIMFSKYGEIRNARTLAQTISNARKKKRISTTGDLIKAIEPCIKPANKRNKYITLVFQSLRIEVNDELNGLQTFLNQCYEVLAPKGRLAVITYHSLEDRIVKNFFKAEDSIPGTENSLYGQKNEKFRMISKKPIQPSDNEIEENPRVRSAKLRIAEKI